VFRTISSRRIRKQHLLATLALFFETGREGAIAGNRYALRGRYSDPHQIAAILSPVECGYTQIVTPQQVTLVQDSLAKVAPISDKGGGPLLSPAI
jgi:hypothetical protein